MANPKRPPPPKKPLTTHTRTPKHPRPTSHFFNDTATTEIYTGEDT
eukprot:COSAG05_NODE_23932_length_255_cov_0.192308_1_plen_45_part_10